MFNLIRQELRLQGRSWLIATSIIIIFQVLFTSAADLYKNNDQMLKTIKSLPKQLLEGFGIKPELLGSFEGWMSGQPYNFYILMFGIFVAIWACTGIAKERDQGTSEYLFSLPYSRPVIFLSKVTAHWIEITVIYLLCFTAMYGFGSLFSDVENPWKLFLLATSGYFISLAFTGVGFVITVLIHSERTALSLGVGIVMISFLLKFLVGLNEKISWMADFSLFTAFSTERIITDSCLSCAGMISTLSIYFTGIAIGCYLLTKQDI